MRGIESRRQISKQRLEGPRFGCGPRHENIVMPPSAQKGKQLRRGGAQAALGAIAGNGIADLAADGETDPDGRHVAISRPKFSGDWRHLEHETGHGTAPPGLDAQEISAVRQTPEACRGQFY